MLKKIILLACILSATLLVAQKAGVSQVPQAVLQQRIRAAATEAIEQNCDAIFKAHIQPANSIIFDYYFRPEEFKEENFKTACERGSERCSRATERVRAKATKENCWRITWKSAQVVCGVMFLFSIYYTHQQNIQRELRTKAGDFSHEYRECSSLCRDKRDVEVGTFSFYEWNKEKCTRYWWCDWCNKNYGPKSPCPELTEYFNQCEDMCTLPSISETDLAATEDSYAWSGIRSLFGSISNDDLLASTDSNVIHSLSQQILKNKIDYGQPKQCKDNVNVLRVQPTCAKNDVAQLRRPTGAKNYKKIHKYVANMDKQEIECRNRAYDLALLETERKAYYSDCFRRIYSKPIKSILAAAKTKNKFKKTHR